jgi:Flavodoxin-like fold
MRSTGIRHVSEVLPCPHARRHVYIEITQHRQVVSRIVECRLSRFAELRRRQVVLRGEVWLRRDPLVEEFVGGEDELLLTRLRRRRQTIFEKLADRRGRVGGTRMYENGLGQGRRRAMVIMTTGGAADAFGLSGIHPSLQTILNPIEHGIFWFNGFLSLRPFIAFQPARLSHNERTSYLRALGERLKHIEGEQPRTGDERSG